MIPLVINDVRSRAVLLWLVLLASGCSAATLPPRSAGLGAGLVITAEEIERTGAKNAWEALRRANLPLAFREDRIGRPLHFSRRGGLTSPLVVVDGTLTHGLELLYQIAAGDISSIRVLEALDASQRYGQRGGGGAILIETKRGPRR